MSVQVTSIEAYVEVNTTEAVVNIVPIGEQGIPGEGVPIGGTTGQVLAKASNTDYDTAWVTGGGGGGAVDSVNGYTGIVILNANDVGAYSNTNPSNFINSAGAPVQSVNGDTGIVVLTAIDVGAYPDNNPNNFINSAQAPIQSVTGTLVTGTSANPVVDIPTLDQVGAYSNTNPLGFINIAQVPIKTVTGDGVDNTNVGNVVISWPTPDDIGAYSNTNPSGYITSAQAPVQSVNGKTNVVVLDVNDVGAYSNTNPSNFINVAQASAAAPVQSVNGDTGTVVLDASDVGAYPDTNPSNFIDASGAPVQSVNGDTGTVVLDYADVGADPVWTTTTANSGTLTGLQVVWLADTTSARNRTLDATGIRLQVKDTTGSAETNNITLTAPSGQTINGNATETVDVDYGWVEYVRNGTNWVTIGGQA
jgi:hypothetical protein